MISSWQESYDKSRQCIKRQRHHFANKGPYSQNYGLSSSHVRMWELDPEEGRVPKNRCFQTMVLEKIFESPLNIKEIKLINPKGNQPWIFTGRTDLEAWDPILWPLDVKSWLIGKDPDTRKGWGQDEKGAEGDVWVASLIQWTWTQANSGRWWGTGKPGMLQFIGSQRVRQDLETVQQQKPFN